MKPRWIVLVAGVLGVVLGVGVSWANFRESPPLDLTASPLGPHSNSSDGIPRVLVDLKFHDFGAVEDDSTIAHDFRFTNMGDAPLTIEGGTTTCSRCTIAKVERPVLEPGESCNVRVEYRPTHSQPTFRQHATVRTNDPEQEIVELTIRGIVTRAYDVEPQYLVVSRISSKETKTSEIRVYDFLTDDAGVEKCEFLVQDTAKYFEAKTESIPKNELSRRNVRSGCRVLVTIKPGLPVGPIRQTIRLTLNVAERAQAPVVDVPIEGTVDSDVSIVGRGWNSSVSRLMIGAVDGNQGGKANLYVMVRGPNRDDTTITVGKTTPSWLKVTLGEPRNLETGKESGITQIPLTIEIPPGSPAVNYMGAEGRDYARIYLKTTNPDAPRIRLDVQFAVLR